MKRISRQEKQDPDLPASLTDSQLARWNRAMEEGISARYLELLRTAISSGEISFGRFSEMLDMSIQEASEFIKAMGLAV